MYRRKIAEVDAYLTQLSVVREELRAKLAAAVLRRDTARGTDRDTGE